MNLDTKRKTAAWILLAVYLPMLILAGLHVHPELERTSQCHQCVSHQPHAGHISSQGAAHHDCVLCQFLTLPGLEPLSADVTFSVSADRPSFVIVSQPVISMASGSMRTRAPPQRYDTRRGSTA